MPRNISVFMVILLLPSLVLAGPLLYPKKDCSKVVVQIELNQCAGANAEAADKALNAVYRQLLKQDSDPNSVVALKESERAWLVYREKECARELGPQEEGGSIWPMEMSSCLEDKTAARIRELRLSLDCPVSASGNCPG